MQQQVSVVVLAAGMSRRASGNKLLYTVSDGTTTVIEKLIATVLESKVGPIIVVLGYEADKVLRPLEKTLASITIVVNHNYTAGMSESVKTGVYKAVKSYPHNPIMILPADCFLITAEDIRKIAMVYTSSDKKIIVASYNGRNGHPVIFSQDLIPEILAINEETRGLKALFKKHNSVQVETNNPGVLKDFDTDRDFQDYRKNE